MATVPGQLIWEIIKNNNYFLVKEFDNGTQRVQFSKEPNNLYNLNSYKHSGLANKKTVTIQPAGKEQDVLLATTKTKKQGKPATLLNKSVMKKEFYRMAKGSFKPVSPPSTPSPDMRGRERRSVSPRDKRYTCERSYSRSPMRGERSPSYDGPPRSPSRSLVRDELPPRGGGHGGGSRSRSPSRSRRGSSEPMIITEM